MKIGIIGGGAAGMLAACTAAEYGAQVTVLERNKSCGVKLKLTGKGRCNVTNACDLNGLLAHTPRNGRFLYSAYSAYMPEDVIAFFEEWGVPMKTERGNRVFPQSDKSGDIVDALRRCMKQRGVIVRQGRVEALRPVTGGWLAIAGSAEYAFDRVILATGGLSYPRTGSTGDGYDIARALGHTVTPTRPSLVPLKVRGDNPQRLEGLSLRNISISIEKEGKSLYTDFGELLFTAEGLSGPLILSGSAHLTGEFPYQLTIDLKPALDHETLDKRLLSDFNQNINRDFGNALSALLPTKMIPVVIGLCGIPPTQKVNGITRTQREGLCRLLKSLPFEITGYGSWHEAVITSGGIAVQEIDPKTMESKIVSGLYFVGEVIDVDAYTGGFNLQIAWATAYKAAIAAATRG